jgi:hypothetical protein
MRNIFKVSFLSGVLVTLLISGTGCLKDELADNQQTNPDIAGSPSIIEIPGPVRVNTSYRSSYAIGLAPSTKDTTFNVVTVRLASDQPAPEDIQVELELVPALLTAYNDSTGTHLVPFPTTGYKFDPGLTLSIPKGSREASIRMTTLPNSLVGKEYGFGFRIKSVSNSKYLISGNYNAAVVAVGVRNKYDGDYKLKIKHTGWAAYSIADGLTFDNYPTDIGMITASANSVALYNYYYGAGLQPGFDAGGNPTAFGAATPVFAFDLATDKLLSVTNSSPDDGRGRAFALNPAITTSRYDPATKTIYAAYFLKQNGRPDMAIYDTLTYIKARQ